jgi:DNA-binding YbaB/EbfC family protein
MKARIPGANNGQSQAAMLKQVQKMQEDMQTFQAEFEDREFTATAGGGIVEVTMTGNHELKKVHIDPEAVDPEDVEMLEDYITIAINEVVKNIAATQENEMAAITGGLSGLNIPGLF